MSTNRRQLSFDSLFTITPSGELTVNAKELRGHVILGDIVKGSVSRKDGIRDLLYVYLMSDPRSKYDHLNPDEKEEATRIFIGASEGWKPPQNLLAGIEYYKAEIELTPTGKAFGASKKAMYEIGRDVYDNLNTISYLKEQMQKKLVVIKANESNATTDMDMTNQMTLIGECNKLIKESVTVQNSLIKQINELPEFIKTVEALADKWAKESGGSKEVHGGGDLGNRE